MPSCGGISALALGPTRLTLLGSNLRWHNATAPQVLFVVLREGLQLEDAGIAEIKAQIRNNTTPRHVPAVVAQVEDIPRTKSGKITEVAVREVIHQRPIKNVDALANPEALAHYENRPELALAGSVGARL